jgi:imidazolonepropionase-like amidohydrolase
MGICGRGRRRPAFAHDQSARERIHELREFGLDDRGTIVVGARADLLLVPGDPTESVDDSSSVSEG